MRYNRIFFILLVFTLFFGSCQQTKAAQSEPPEDFIQKVTFLGDSITAHMAARAQVSAAQIWATKERYLNLDSRITYAKIVAPDTGKEDLIADVAARLKPPYLIITLGVDYGVYYYRNDLALLVKYYEKLIDSIESASPQTKVILQSIFPVTKDCKNITNEMIDNANAAIREMAARRAIPYLDTQSVLRDEDGFLRAAYCSDTDGIHLSASGYEQILSYIRAKAETAGWA
ncbi:MAG: hypothetical protein E7624_00385 [Ruminococcaceae bacterium]|nr:hypothetical protein [Oscillospiraceae bacterium]